MPLRDHFHAAHTLPVSPQAFYGGWPAMIVKALSATLPPEFVAAQRVRVGTRFGSYADSDPHAAPPPQGEAAPAFDPALAGLPGTTHDLELRLTPEYQVRILDRRFGRRLAAVVQLVAPANKDRPDHRTMFAVRCYDLLRDGIAVTIVDAVTSQPSNLVYDMLKLLGQPVPSEFPPTYVASCFPQEWKPHRLLHANVQPLEVGKPLPVIPLRLDANVTTTLDLEASYEDACRVLRVP